MKAVPHKSSGVALIITLILLAVITFMAVTFLVISTSERKAVSVTTDQSVSRLAADSAYERAIAEIMARIFANSNNLFIGDFTVSTNYINTNGFVPGNSYPTNVNYDFVAITRGPLTVQQQQQNIANLLFNPRVPVIMTNPIAHTSEFRFYLDENRNGVFDATGLVIETNSFGFRVTNSVVGDPQWIGLLERPGFPHSSSNYFMARIAWVVIPSSKTLDINYIHNDASWRQLGINGRNMQPGYDGFRRDMGAGTHEINLAALLNDLNTNLWPSLPNSTGYNYVNNLRPNAQNTGYAFDDALAILGYRYGWSPLNLQPVPGMGVAGARSFSLDGIDEMLTGPVMTDFWWPQDYDGPFGAGAASSFPWAGIDNMNHYFSIQDLFDRTKVKGPGGALPGFVDRLLLAGNATDSYDRSTFYRLLQQLGTDSAPEPAGRMNLNYDNLVQKNSMGVASATNFYAWKPVDFFVNAANRLLTNAGYAFPPLAAIPNPTSSGSLTGFTNGIEIFPTNLYTPGVHRMLQLAANMYDATTNRLVPSLTTNGLSYPSVFRPIFYKPQNGTNVFIVGYREETDASMAGGGFGTAPNMRDLNNPADLAALNNNNIQQPDMVYGVPLVIGAKKGWPNFNEFAMQTTITVTRKLQFSRPNIDSDVNHTNQMYMLGISNVFGMEGWNSYAANVSRPLQMIAVVEQMGAVSNELARIVSAPYNAPTLLATNYTQSFANSNIAATTWPGFLGTAAPEPSFKVPIYTNYWVLTNSEYRFNSTGDPPNPNQGTFVPISGVFESNSVSMFPLPHWWLGLQTRARFILVDTTATPYPRIVDYVNLNSVEPPIDINGSIMNGAVCNGADGNDGSEWCTNRQRGLNTVYAPTYGILSQIGVSMGTITPPSWKNYIIQSPVGSDVAHAIAFFAFQFGNGASDGTFGISNVFNAPFTPFRNIIYYTSWEANDPLVHYTIGDLINGALPNRMDLDQPNSKSSTITNLGKMNMRYEPWGGGGNVANSSSTTKYDMTVKDPGVTRSDDWNFPTNKLANVGWLGRIHRGTPWQTVNLKATPVSTNEFAVWKKWTGDIGVNTNFGQIMTNTPFGFFLPVWNGNTNTVGSNTVWAASFSVPTNDYRILDLFSTAPSDYVTRGRLSINQTNLAAWSAVLSGVNVLTNGQFSSTYTNLFIQPAGIYDPAAPPPLVKILAGINSTRTNCQNGTFQRLGDILATPELTVRSPYLNLNYTNAINDAMYERIPQQILGLLQCDPAPRFVVYSYGQALKPAEHSLVTGGQFFGLCTNYQVMAETVTRTVVRIDGGTNAPHAVIESFNVLPPD
jgi:hypothetical protein